MSNEDACLFLKCAGPSLVQAYCFRLWPFSMLAALCRAAAAIQRPGAQRHD